LLFDGETIRRTDLCVKGILAKEVELRKHFFLLYQYSVNLEENA
jgi:hypothetical protein